MPAAMPSFRNLPILRWEEEAVRRYLETGKGPGLPHEPKLRRSFDAVMAQALQPASPLLDGGTGIPLVAIRGAKSDLLSRKTYELVLARRPDVFPVEVNDRGYAPFLDEPEVFAAIRLCPECCFGS